MHVRPVSTGRLFATFLTLVTLLVAGAVSTTHAQLPGQLSYQGQILADDGRPVADGVHQIDVALYGDEYASEPLWRESHLAEFSGGLFSIYLGSLNPLNLPFDRQYWLGVSFDGRGEMAERTPLSSSPYAVRSQIAGDIDGGAVRSINGRQGNLQLIGTGGTVVTEKNGVITIGTTLPKSIQGGPKVEIAPDEAQSSDRTNAVLHLDETGTGEPNMIEMEVDGSDVFVVDNDGNVTTTGSLTGGGISFSSATVTGASTFGDGVGDDDFTVNPGTGTVSFSNAPLEDVADPTNPQDAATKNYVDNSTSAIDLTGEPFVTFETGSAKLTNNRVLAAGTGVSITNAAADNGSMTVAIGQDVATTASPTFDGLRLTNVSPNSSSTEVLVSNGGDLESRSANSLAPEFYNDFWRTDGNSGTSPGADYIGTSDAQALHLYVNGGADNSLVLTTNGSIQRGTDGDARGAFATDLQISRTGNTQVASGSYATIGGGQNNTSRAGATTVAGGVGNEAAHTWATVGGGSINEATGWGSVVGGGRGNQAGGHGSTVAGGVYNSASGLYSAIPGGRDLTLSGSGSFGFLTGVGQSANNTNPGTRPMSIAEGDVAVFGNADMWLANNDGNASQLRFYESNSATGAFPNGTNYTSFEAGDQTGDINYTLPTSLPTIDNQILAGTTAGVMSWVDRGVTSLSAGAGLAVDQGTGDVTIMNTGVTSLNGTAGQVTIDQSTGDVTLSLPQDIDQNATPTFDGLTLDNMAVNTTSTDIVVSSNGVLETRTAASLIDDIGENFWNLGGNAGTTSSSYIGTSDNQPVRMLANGGSSNGMILNTNGSLQRGEGGNARGTAAVDLQWERDDPFSVTDADANVASGIYSVIAGGQANLASGRYSTVLGGLQNRATSDGDRVGGGVRNTASGGDANVAGGSSNIASGVASTVLGGYRNEASGNFSSILGGDVNDVSGARTTILGGRNLTLTGSESFGYLSGASSSTRSMTVSASNTGLLGNVDLWLANNDGSASQLRFYEANSTTGAFPNGTNYTSFRAGNQAGDINYTLPTALPTSNGQVLTSNTSGAWSWSNSLNLSSLTTTNLTTTNHTSTNLTTTNLSATNLSATNASVTNLEADTVEGDVAEFSNASSSISTLTLDNSGTGGISLEIAGGGIQLGYATYTALSSGKADDAGGYPRVSQRLPLAIVTDQDGNSGPYAVRPPASGSNGQILYIMNVSGGKILVRDTKEGAMEVNDDRVLALIYWANSSGGSGGWRPIVLQDANAY